VRDRKSSQISQLERLVGRGIIAPQRAIVPIFIDRGAPLSWDAIAKRIGAGFVFFNVVAIVGEADLSRTRSGLLADPKRT